MVQYIPPSPQSYPYPNANRADLNYEIMGNLGTGMGSMLSGAADAFNQYAQMQKQRKLKQQQDDFLNMTVAQLQQMMQPPQPMQGPMPPSGPAIKGPTGYKPPNQGPSSTAVPAGQQPMQPRPMVGNPQMSPQMTMRTMQMIQQISPFLSKRVADTLMPPPQTQAKKLPNEVYYIDPATGEPSLMPKKGFVPQEAPAGTAAKSLTQWHYRKILEGDKDARLHLSKTIADSRIADQVNKSMMPVDNALETYKSLLGMRQKMSKQSLERVQDILKNPNPNFLVAAFRTNDPDATNYYNQLLAARNSLKGIAANKLAGKKDLDDLAHLFPDGSEDPVGLKNKMMAFNRAADVIRARTISSARIKEASLGMNDENGQVNQLMGLPAVGDIDMGEEGPGSDFSDVDKELGN